MNLLYLQDISTLKLLIPVHMLRNLKHSSMVTFDKSFAKQVNFMQIGKNIAGIIKSIQKKDR